MNQPAMMAIAKPVTMYNPAICQPNRPKSMASATSFTIGVAIRKEKVTPRGMPVSTKPMNSGTAEQEQKGVTTPNPAASTFPTPSRFPPSNCRVRSALKKLRSNGHQEDHAAQQQE